MFGIAVSGALRELAGSLASLPSERTDGAVPQQAPADELSQRRQRRTADRPERQPPAASGW